MSAFSRPRNKEWPNSLLQPTAFKGWVPGTAQARAWHLKYFLSLLLLTVAFYLTLGFSAKLFRVGVLLYGKRPTIREIWRWVRA